MHATTHTPEMVWLDGLRNQYSSHVRAFVLKRHFSERRKQGKVAKRARSYQAGTQDDNIPIPGTSLLSPTSPSLITGSTHLDPFDTYAQALGKHDPELVHHCRCPAFPLDSG
jgi:hypothetical protein